jgi:rhodanese-related sulfurtransferase
MGETWNKLMGSYWKEQAKINHNKQIRADRHKEAYAGEGKKLKCSEIKDIHDAGGWILDLRNPVDYATTKIIFNAINVPASNVLKWVLSNHQINEHTPILLYSQDGKISESVKNDLTQEGVNYKNVANIGSINWYSECSG